jgi:hypothetical protein
MLRHEYLWVTPPGESYLVNSESARGLVELIYYIARPRIRRQIHSCVSLRDYC